MKEKVPNKLGVGVRIQERGSEKWYGVIVSIAGYCMWNVKFDKHWVDTVYFEKLKLCPSPEKK